MYFFLPGMYSTFHFCVAVCERNRDGDWGRLFFFHSLEELNYSKIICPRKG